MLGIDGHFYVVDFDSEVFGVKQYYLWLAEM